MTLTHLSGCSHPFVPTTKNQTSRTLAAIGISVLLLLTALPSVAQQAANTISTVAGGGPTPTNPTLADLPGPTATIKNAAGTLFIAAPYSSYIYQLSTGGVFSVYAGFGYGGFNDDGQTPANTQLGFVGAFATDSQGNLYFADFGNSRVRMVSASTGLVTTVAGQSEKCAHNYATCGDGGPAVNAQLNLPNGVAVDASGNVYIADSSDNRIRKVDAVSHNISTVAGATVNNVDNNCSNPTLACGDGGAATSANLNFPTGVAVDAVGNIYIADSGDHRVRIVDHVTGIINRYAGDGGACIVSTNPCGDGHLANAMGTHLHGPTSIALDASGNGFIADQLDHRIRRVDAVSNIITTVAGTGAQGYTGDGAAATAASLNLPYGVYIDSSNSLYISDTGNQRIRKVDAAGNISLVAGGGNGGDGGPATQATLAGPYSIMEDPSGSVYFTDTYNNRIRKLSSGVITTFAGTGNAGYFGDGVAATSATFDGPSSIVRDSNGNFYIADENNMVVRKIDPSGNITRFAGTVNKSCTPTTAACGDTGLATNATFASPQTLAIDPRNNNLYIADYFAHRVRMVNVSTGVITTVAGVGNFGNSGDGGLATAAHLNHPSGIVVDNAGNLYISDQYNNRIRVVKPCTANPANQCIFAFALNSAAHLAGDGGPAINGSMWNPLEITIDPAQNLYVSGGNDRVVQIIDAATQYWGTVAGNSTKASSGGFSGDGGPAQLARLANAGSSVDGSGNLYIADQGNNRIRYVPLAPAITNTPPSLSFGNVMIGTTSPAKNLTTLSAGGLDLNLTSPISITGPNAANFAIATNSCTGVTFLAPNRKCTEGITFSPTAFGKSTASLTFTDNATGSPQTVALSGSGPDFSMSAAPSSITVNKGATGNSTVTLVPLGGFNNPVKLTVLGCPASSTCTVNPTTVPMNGTSNGTSAFQVVVGSTTASGVYTITVKGTFTPIQHPATITLTVP